MRLLHTSDLHLGRKGREEDIWKQWEKIVALTQQEKVDILIIAGDIFDNGQAERRLKQRFCSSLERLTREGITVLVIPGNHDLRQGNALEGIELPGVKVAFDYEVVILEGIAFHLFPFSPEITGQDLVKIRQKTEAKFEIGVCHASYVAIRDIFNDLGDSQAIHIPLLPEDVKLLQFDYLALGHYHNAKYWQVGKTHCVYPGSIEPLSFKEKGKRQVFIGHFSNEIAISPIEIGCQQSYQEITVQIPPEGFEGAWREIETLPKRFGPCFLKIHLKGIGDEVLVKVWQQKVEKYLKEQAISVIWEDQTVDMAWIESTPLARQFRNIVQKRLEKSPQERDYWWRVLYRGVGCLKECYQEAMPKA